MSEPLSLPADPALAAAASGDGDAWARAVLAEQVDTLGQLARIGLTVAKVLERRAETLLEADEEEDVAQAAGPAPDEADAAQEAVLAALPGRDGLFLAYARVSRAIRLALMLQEKLVKDLLALDAGALVTREDQVREEQTQERKARLLRAVRRIGVQASNAFEAEQLVGRARERLDRDDIYGDLLARPASELIAAICADLGLAPDWPALAREAWAREEIASGRPGAPLRALPEWEDEDWAEDVAFPFPSTLPPVAEPLPP